MLLYLLLLLPPPCTLLASVLTADRRRSVICVVCGCCIGTTLDFLLDPCTNKEAPARWSGAALLGWCSFSVRCRYSLVVDVGGTSVFLCCCYNFPSSPLPTPYSWIMSRSSWVHATSVWWVQPPNSHLSGYSAQAFATSLANSIQLLPDRAGVTSSLTTNSSGFIKSIA